MLERSNHAAKTMLDVGLRLTFSRPQKALMPHIELPFAVR
jgi:hypothetical protein